MPENVNGNWNGSVSAGIDFPLCKSEKWHSRRGYIDESMNTNELVWNARLTKRMMKGKLLLQFDALDLLGNLSNVRRTINAQGKTETFYNVIPSYCLLHLTWRIK